MIRAVLDTNIIVSALFWQFDRNLNVAHGNCPYTRGLLWVDDTTPRFDEMGSRLMNATAN